MGLGSESGLGLGSALLAQARLEARDVLLQHGHGGAAPRRAEAAHRVMAHGRRRAILAVTAEAAEELLGRVRVGVRVGVRARARNRR